MEPVPLSELSATRCLLGGVGPFDPSCRGLFAGAMVPELGACHHRGMSAAASEPSTLIAAGAAELLAGNPIQAGRITPHKAFDGDGVRIRHLAMDANTVLTEHSAPRPILVAVASGRVRFTIGEVTHTLVPGGIIHVAASVPHAVTADEPSHLLIYLLG